MRTLRKTLALVLAIAMVLTTFGAVTVSANTYADTNGHWAEGVIDTWSGHGVIQGDGGYFRPDDAITRAEVAQITQNVIGYVTSAPNSFIDVADNAWYTDAILKLVAADVLTGNGDGTMTPDANMTREEAMTMLSRAYGLAPVNNMASITNYADYSSISDYAQGYIGAMTAAGYVGGYPDGTIRPKDNIARGEFVKILDNMIKLYITGPGTYGPGYFGGIVMVKSGGVTLNGVIADKAVVSPLVSGDVVTNNAQLTNGVLNLSDSATVNSEQGNGTSLSGVIAGGYYGGSYGGGSSSSGVRNYTIRFYVDGELYATKTAAYNSYLSASLPVDPTAANQVFVGWYESQEDANAADTLEPIDPSKTRVTGTTDYYAGFTATSAVPTQAPTVSIKDPSEEYDPSAPTEVKAELVTKDGKDVTVNSVVWGGTEAAAQSVTLTKDKDYTIEGNTVKFSEEFLSSLYDGTHNIQIMTDAGAVSFDIVVNGSSVAVPTAAPATEAPATEAPATEVPAEPTQAPATQAPATQAPATQAPATQAPAKLYNATLKVNGGEGTLAAAAPEEPTQAPAEPTAAPAEPTQAPDNPPAVGGESKVWNFTEGEWKDFSFTLDENAASQKTVDGITVGAVKGVTGGKSITTSAEDGLKLSASGSCYFSYTATEAGTIKFTVKASGDSPYKKDGDTTLRSIKITKGTEKEKEDTYCSADPVVLTKDYSYDLAAGETIKVAGGTNGFYLPALSFTPAGGGSVEPGPAEPTQAPAEPTQAPSTDATAAPAPEGSSSYTVDKNALISEGTKLTDDANVTVVSKYISEVGEDKNPQTLTIGGKEFDSTSFLRVRSQNSKPKSVSDLTFFASTGATNEDGTPSSFNCTILEITPHVDGVFKIYYRRQPESKTTDFTPDGGKDTKLADETTGTVPCASENIETITEAQDYGYGTKTWNLSKDKLYGLWAGGTTGTIYGYEFIPAASASDATAEAAELTPVEDTDGLYKYIREQYVDDNLEISFTKPDSGEISYKSTFGNKNITVYRKDEGTAPKLGTAKTYDGGRIILRTGTMKDEGWEVDLNNVVAVCAPYDCKIQVRAGQSGGSGVLDMSINAQTGLGLDNPTKKVLSYSADRNDDVIVPETYSAKAGDIVYFWFDGTAGTGTVIAFTFIKDDGSSTEPEQPTAAPAEPTQAPTEPTAAPAEPTQAPDNPPAVGGETKVWDFSSEAWAEFTGEGKEVATEQTVDGITICGAAGKKITVATNEKVNDGKTTYLNLGGSGSWYFKYKAETDGKIAFTIHSSGAAVVNDGVKDPSKKDDSPRSVLIKVGSKEATNEAYTTVTPEELSKDFSYDLKAGETIQVGGKGSTNGFWLTALSFTPAGGGSVEPTQAPAEPTNAPAEPTQAPATAEPGTTVYQFEEGATVTYSGTPAVAGAVPTIKVTGADGKDISVSGNSFTMPAQDVKVEVTYTGGAPSKYEVSIGDITGEGDAWIVVPDSAEEPAPTEAPTAAPAEPTAAPATEAPTEAPTAAPPAETPGTQEPAEGNNYPEGSIVWDFGKEPFVNADGTVNTTMFPEGDHKNDAGEIDRYNVGPESIVDVNGLTYYSVSDLGTKPSLNANQPSNRTFSDGASFTRMIKSQGRGSITPNEETGEDVKDKCFEFKAPFDGTITLYARSGGSDTDANITFAINGSDVAKYTVIKTKEEDADNLPVFTKTGVFTGDTVQIYSDNNTSYYAIVFSPAAASAVAAADEPAASTEPAASSEPGGIPADKFWKLDNQAVKSALANYKTADTAPVENVDGAVVGPGYTYDASRSVKYTHANGQEYTLTGSLRGGSGSTEKLYVSIIPEPCACTVTVVFDGHGSAGRTQNIAYDADGDGTPEVVSSKASETGATAVTYDMTAAQAASGKPVYTYGGGSNKNLYAIFIEYYEETPEKWLSGSIMNQTGRDFTDKNIVFTNDDDPSETYTVPFADDYMVKLPKGKTFTATVEGESDVCTTIEGQHISIEQNRYNQEMDLTFVLIADAEVSGKVSTISSHDLLTPVYDYDAAIGAKLTFTKQGAAEPYATADVAADGTYKATLMSNETYDIALTTADGQAYTLSPLSGSYQFLAGDQAPFKNILLMKDGPAALDYKDTLTVGSDKEYKSISEALAAVRLMSREPGQVVNIVIDPGTYEEQLYVNIDDIALKAADPAAAEKDSDKRPLITWYYGIGYVYDSSAPQTDAGDPETGEGKSYQGWYSADYAVAKTSQWTVNNWGSTIRTLNRGFYMENIDAQSSFNLYITEKELSDHVTPGGGDAKVGVFRDDLDTAVNNRTYNERAAAIFAGGSEIELYNCSFVSSQDTFGTGAKSMYVKDCLISGNTDYICGGDNCYFENCELRWQGMSDTDNGGYITACKNSAETDLGYYFKNCTITKNPASGMQAGKGGNWGRPWGGKGKTVTIFDNTTIGDGVNKPTGWTSMSSSQPSDAIYYVVNGVYKASDPATDITASADNPNGKYDANGYTLPTPEQYFGDWAPANYGTAPSDENLAKSYMAAPGETIMIKTSPKAKSVLTLPGTEVKPVEGKDGYYTFEMPAADTKVNVEF